MKRARALQTVERLENSIRNYEFCDALTRNEHKELDELYSRLYALRAAFGLDAIEMTRERELAKKMTLSELLAYDRKLMDERDHADGDHRKAIQREINAARKAITMIQGYYI